MKFFPIALGLLLTLSSYSLAQETKSTPAEILNLTPKKVYVIPVKNEIEDALTFLIRRGVKEAIRDKADILVLHMDTPGGKVSSTLDILKILEKFPNQSQTYTFIDPWAISAGALISSGTRNIYMSPTAIIGAAAPVMSSPGGTGGPQQMPSTMEEKMNSALRAQIRALAERNGR
jgi:membrane-bound serine protease (ClpP class)